MKLICYYLLLTLVVGCAKGKRVDVVSNEIPNPEIPLDAPDGRNACDRYVVLNLKVPYIWNPKTWKFDKAVVGMNEISDSCVILITNVTRNETLEL